MPAAPPNAAADRDNHFNFLRLFLAALVLLAHAPELTDGDRRREPLTRLFGTISFGELAVAGFFLLSGFLIVQSWRRRPSLAAFLGSRALRIYPGFIVAALVSVCIVGPLGAASARRYLARLHPLALLADVALLRSPGTPPVFAGQPEALVNGNLWTVSYEFACYLGVALLGVSGLLRRPRAFLAFTVLAAGVWLLPMAGQSLLLFTAAHGSPAEVRALYAGLMFCQGHATFLHLWLVFCAGGCFALFRPRLRFSQGWAWVASAAMAVGMLSVVGSQLAFVTVGAYAFFTFAFARLPALDVFKGRTDVSYGVYLYGWPVQKLLLWHLPALSPWALFPLSALGAAAVGWASWRLVESPCLRLKSRLAAAPPLAAPPPAAIPFAASTARV